MNVEQIVAVAVAAGLGLFLLVLLWQRKRDRARLRRGRDHDQPLVNDSHAPERKFAPTGIDIAIAGRERYGLDSGDTGVAGGIGGGDSGGGM
jgi:hypothetical protein